MQSNLAWVSTIKLGFHVCLSTLLTFVGQRPISVPQFVLGVNLIQLFTLVAFFLKVFCLKLYVDFILIYVFKAHVKHSINNKNLLKIINIKYFNQ